MEFQLFFLNWLQFVFDEFVSQMHNDLRTRNWRHNVSNDEEMSQTILTLEMDTKHWRLH